ncbi:hypothetical protein ONS95_010989 [Cadophora gregata]|uniref:uncharacterized protein n=1 Tax=Cadophora gregata TaxID=51156 RepID=UPI0026DA9D07|nr:uncharacterized protein ONS95_010989 [Cadophora gregata]KAK0119549.1 hypothetical protein ONS95_010989 [Cadophora gregata]
MAHAPPSYEAAAYRQLWIIVAPYVHSYDLYRACLVCRQWHQLFAPFLWGDPARKFGFDDDNIYLNLTRFKRLLTRARLDVRRLAHTLHIPPAQPEFYDGPQAGWLRDILDRLPCLQALIVSNLSFFDHSSLQGIHQRRQSITTYPLKLLIASNCENTTASSLTTALLHFPELVYLDLSAAQGARSPYVLRQIGTLTELRVLKLRNCGLKDDDIDHLNFSGLRSLDVSCNLLTERGLAKLFAKLPTTPPSSGNLSPFARRYSGIPLPTRVVAEGLDRFIVKRLTSGIDGYLGVEEGLPPAFSHLDVASNYFTVDVLAHLAGHHDLQHLDCGALNLSQKPNGGRSPHSPGALVRRFSDLPEVEILSSGIYKHTFRDLRYLRIHHSLITAQPFSGIEASVEDRYFELHNEDLRYELDSMEVGRPGVFELDDTSIIPPEPEGPVVHSSFESPDDVGAQVRTAQSDSPQNGSSTTNSREARPVEPTPEVRVTFAPVDEGTKSSHPIPIRTKETFPTADEPPRFDSSDDMESQIKTIMPDEMKTLGTCWAMRNTDKGRPTPRTTPSPISVSPEDPQPPKLPPRPPKSAPNGPERYQYTYRCGTAQIPQKSKDKNIRQLLDDSTQRLQNLTTRERHPGRFKPSLLPNLKSLTLTSIPSTTYRHSIPDTLALFIRELAEEEELARLQEIAKYQSINQPPPQRSPTSTLKLKCLILEMTSQPDTILPHRTNSPLALGRTHSNSRSKRASFSSNHYTKSSTEDPDSESFMNSISSDFSFFSEDDGGLLVSEGRIDSPNPGRGEFGFDVGGDEREVDVVMELSAFRRARKREFEEATEKGVWGIEQVLGGFWRGEVKVVRESVGGGS